MYKLVAGTGAFNVDLSSKTTPMIPKRLASWHFSAVTAAALIHLRNGSLTGDILAEIQIAAGASASEVYSSPTFLLFPDGLFVEVASGGTSVLKGSVDLI
jgi:hypothetical protein